MRPIPPNIWALMLVVGHLQKAIDETANIMLFGVLATAQREIEQYLEWTRKEKRK